MLVSVYGYVGNKTDPLDTVCYKSSYTWLDYLDPQQQLMCVQPFQ